MPAAETSARVPLARASGMPGWSRTELKFSRANTTPCKDELESYAGEVPVVSLLRNDVGEPTDSVSSDDHEDIRMAAEHLGSLGHRRTVHVDGGSAASAEARRSAFRAEMEGTLCGPRTWWHAEPPPQSGRG